jgi:hypothetical protein
MFVIFVRTNANQAQKTRTNTHAQNETQKHQIFMYFNENTQTQFVRFSILPKNFRIKESK